MRTPLASILFFLTFILKFVQKLELAEPNTQKQQALKYLNLVQSQVQLMQSYVSDLLDLRQFKDGVFTLASETFNPAEVFTLICNIFNP